MKYIFLSFLAVTPFTSLAAPATYDLLAPLGTLPGTVTLTQYLKGVFETAIGLTGVLAVIMIVVCGIRLMGTGSVAGKSEAKECIWNAVFGILIAIGSWLLLNTINPLLLKNNAELSVSQPGVAALVPGAPTTQAKPTGLGCYFQYKENSSGNTKYAESDTEIMCEALRNDYQSSGSVAVLTNCFCNKPASVGVPKPTAAPPVTSTAGSITCPDSGWNLCEEKSKVCSNSSCAQFTSLITPVGNATVNLIKAVIMQETSCIAIASDAVGDNGASGGPMHIKPETANKYLSKCGLTNPVTVSWLATKANWKDAICLSANYLDAISKTTCGKDIRNIAAGYNGGSGVCAPSADCGGDKNCAGVTVQKWECLYADPGHKQCDAGYRPTRNYAMNVLYCTNHPGF